MAYEDAIGSQIKKLRSSRGWSQVQLADKLGVSRQTVSNWETNLKVPRMGALQKISDLFKVSIGYITDGEDVSVQEENASHEYNFFDFGLSAGVLTTVDPFKATDVKKITVPDLILGKYAGDNHLFITYINGESMNRILPDHSLIAVKEYDSVSDLKDSDIVAFEDSGEMCVKLFYKDFRSRTYSFMPSSTDPSFKPITYRWEEANQIKIVGKVVTYVVNI